MNSELLTLIEQGNKDLSIITNRLDSLEADQTKSNRPNFGGMSSRNAEWKDAYESLKSQDFNSKVALSEKAIVSDSGLTAPAISQPLAITAATNSAFISQWIPSHLIDAPSVVVNLIGSTDSAGVQPEQGDSKKLLSVSTSSVTIALKQYAAFCKVSTQAIQDIGSLQSIIANVLNLRLNRSIDNDIWEMANTAGNHTAFVSDSSTIIDNLVLASAQLANYGLSGCIFLCPSDFANLALGKTFGSGSFLGFPSIYESLLIKQASCIPVGKFMLTTLDGLGISLAQRSDVMLIMGYDGDDLSRNLRTCLIEQRLVAYVTDVARVIIGDLVKAD